MASVVSSTPPARRPLIRDVRSNLHTSCRMFESLHRHYERSDQLRALAMLHDPSDYPAMPSLARATMVLQAYVVPSFEPMTSWTLFRLHENDYLVRRVRWDFAADHRPMAVSDPTTYAADSLLDTTFVERELADLASITFPPFVLSRSFGIDGVTFGVRTVSFGSSSEFSWWCRPPAGCESLAEWYHRFVESVESALPAHTDHFRHDV